MNDINNEQKRKQIASMYEGQEGLKKGGEGTKGGKVIGHTRSGKPIYDTFNHPEHKGFDYQDHRDAHAKHWNKLGRQKAISTEDRKHADAHRETAEKLKVHAPKKIDHKKIAQEIAAKDKRVNNLSGADVSNHTGYKYESMTQDDIDKVRVHLWKERGVDKSEIKGYDKHVNAVYGKDDVKKSEDPLDIIKSHQSQINKQIIDTFGSSKK